MGRSLPPRDLHGPVQRAPFVNAMGSGGMDGEASSWTQVHRACVSIEKHANSAKLKRELRRIKYMLEDYHVNIPTKTMNTPLHLACVQDCPSLVRLLISEGADVMAVNRERQTPLHFAVFHGNLEIIDLVLAEPVDVDARDDQGATPLHWALTETEPSAAVVERLLSAGASTSVRDVHGNSALHVAAEEGASTVISTLLAAGADPAARNGEGLTPFLVAIEQDHVAVAHSLVRLGAAKLKESTAMGLSALHVAVRANCLMSIEYLLNVVDGIDVNAVDALERTPLHFAAAGGRRDVVESLLQRGASKHATDGLGKEPYHYAAAVHPHLLNIFSERPRNRISV